MGKKPSSALDYSPRRAKAIEAAHRRPLERATHGVVQRQQHYPIFLVEAGGKCVEWTDLRASAHGVFYAAQPLPKRLSVVYADGRRVLLDEVTSTGRHASQEQRQAA